jgi:hypothetical protein
MNIVFKFFDYLNRLEQREETKKQIEEFVRLQQRKAVILRLKREIEKTKWTK